MTEAARSPRRAAYAGRPASPGLALGPVIVDRKAGPRERVAGSVEDERAALESALAAATASLAELMQSTGGDAAEIIEFQLALAEDDTLSAPAFAEIATGTPAHEAWAGAVDVLVSDYQAAEEEYFRARAADLTDLRDRVLGTLSGVGELDAGLPEGAILLAEDVTPSRFLSLDWTGRGIALTGGSTTSHVAMLARSRGVPMLVAIGAVEAGDGEIALLDAETGRLVVAPDADECSGIAEHMARRNEQAEFDANEARRPAVTAGGEEIAVMINVADPAELDAIDPEICDGIGLARTELMFLGAGGLPDEETQLAAYQRLIAWAGSRPVTVRTLDAGGDKPIPGYTLDGESNSFLGVRGVRLSLAHPDVFRVQVRALLRAAAEGDIRIMIPMVSVPAEMKRVKTIVAEEADRLAGLGVPHRVPPVGIMVEVPSAALALERFDTDFASIGSNDLTQLILGVDRDSEILAPLFDERNEAVKSAIRQLIAVAHDKGRKVGICGQGPSDHPDFAEFLVGLGIDSISLNPDSIIEVTRRIAAIEGG